MVTHGVPEFGVMLEFIRKQRLCLEDKFFFNALESLLQLTIGTSRKIRADAGSPSHTGKCARIYAKEYKYRIGVAPGT
jgi:hypothetical protein